MSNVKSRIIIPNNEGESKIMGKQMKIEDAIKEVRTKPLVPLWPTTGTFLGLSRSATYAAAERGDIDVVSIGKLIKAVSASLLKKAKLDDAA